MTEPLRRRVVLGLALGAALRPRSVARAAGGPTEVFRLGILSALPATGPWYWAFVQQLHELGYENDRNLKIDFVQLDTTDSGRALAMAAELVGRGVDVIGVGGPEITLKSAVTATKTVPIVMLATDYDPLARGYVRSLARPGGNVTGVFMQQVELTPKRLEFVSQTAPDLARIVALWDRSSADQFEAASQAARSLKIPLDGIEITNPPYDYERALTGVDGGQRDVLLVMSSPLFFQDREKLAAVALARQLLSMFAFRQFVDAGGLMSYGASLTGMNRLAADYVDRIAKGAKPADLPVQQPTSFELVVNLKTAKALGLTVPPAILARADEVIE